MVEVLIVRTSPFAGRRATRVGKARPVSSTASTAVTVTRCRIGREIVGSATSITASPGAVPAV